MTVSRTHQMLSKIWNWVVRGFRRLFGRNEPASPPPPPPPPRQTLSDAELEAIFMQLLDGVKAGWSRESVKGFLMAKRVTDGEWIAWLRRFEERLQTMPVQHEELARRLVQFGEIRGEELGEVAAEIGRRLLRQIPQSPRTENPQGNSEEIKEAEVWFYRGNEQYERGDFLTAIACFDKALEIKPDDHVGCYGRGNALFNLGRYEEAIACFDEALKIKPDDHDAWYERGIVLRKLGRYEEAIASYDKALTIKPDYHGAWNNRGNALDDLGRYEEAIACFDKALEIKPDYHGAWDNRGIALDNLGHYEEAIASYDKAVEIKPDYHDVWYGRGNALFNLGRYEEAMACFDKALKIKPDAHEAWNNRGNALFNLGRYEEAIASYNKALEIKPYKHFAWNNRGDALRKLGRYEEAIASYDKALEFKPEAHEAWINRGVAAGSISNLTQTPIFLSALALQNPKLNERGYEGALISYEEGLKYCKQDAHPEGWGLLHHQIGDAQYYRGRADRRRRREFWGEAHKSYNTALQTLTSTAYPEEHLKVVKRLIPIQRWFGETEAAKELSRHGSDLFRRLVRECKSPRKKQQLQLKFAGFNQLTVDLHVQEGNSVPAWEVAEEGKNACLTWLINPETEEILTPSYAEIQQLLNPATAAIYWHQSPAALHTFILKHDAPEPIILPGETEEAAFFNLLEFEDWLREWNQLYNALNQGNKYSEQNEEWIDALPEKLRQLAATLKISDILHELKHCADIHQLILIPHRDLHRFPLHTLFLLEETFPEHCTFTYLPSAQFGLKLQENTDKILSKNEQILSLENPSSTYIDTEGIEQRFPPLPAAEIESEMICKMFANSSMRIGHDQVTLEQVKIALQQPHSILHFTGHGFYEFSNPAASALCLTGSELLTVEEIIKLDLSHYKLVGLSACETAVTGNQTITDEYVGLVSAFLRANVSYVLSTLWPVRSDSSKLFMIYFYQQRQAGIPESVAFAATQKWLRSVTREGLQEWYQLQITNFPEEIILRLYFESCIQELATIEENQPFNHPYDWAAFTLAGL